MQFQQLLHKTLKWEGGYSQHQHDRGGATRYGITLGTLRALDRDVNEDDIIDARDVKALTEQQATDIYRQEFFLKPNLSLLPEAIQPLVFDMSVNHGPRRAVRLMQHTLNQTGMCHIDEDGLIGPVTARYAEQAYERMGHYFINAICDERENFYRRIVANDPCQAVFISGWTNRNNDFRIRMT